MLQSLIKLSGKRLFIPLYHSVSDDELFHIKHLYSICNKKQFLDDLDFILKHFNPIDVNTLYESIINKEPVKGNSVLFTFDDGLKEINDIVAPILKQKGIPAIFFINPAFTDNKDLFYRYKASLVIEKLKTGSYSNALISEISKKLNSTNSINSVVKEILNISYSQKNIIDEIAVLLEYDFDLFLKENKPYLTVQQLKNLVYQGFAVGAHSMDHPEYYKISFEEQIQQTVDSVDWVKNNFNQNINLFSFPFTDYEVSKRFFDLIYNPEKPLVDLSFGCAGIKDDYHARNIQRLSMEEKSKSTKQILMNGYSSYLLKRFFGKNRIQRI